MEQVDVLVSGGGIAGLIAAATFGAEGHSVLCVDPAPPITTEGKAGADLRSTAFLQPAQALFVRAGLWDTLEPHATPLRIMRIVDAGGPEAVARLTRDFDSRELGDTPFGWNLPNWLIRREIVQRLANIKGVEFRPGVATQTMVARDEDARVVLSDGSLISAKLVVAADGRDSPLREAAGISARRWRYGQRALAFSVTHELAHQNVSTEIHRTGGPFTLVPLPDRDGQPSSAVVWMDRADQISRLRGLPPEEFERALNARSVNVLGHLKLATGLADWPMISQLARRFSAPRLALIAEAAHVVPPIGAQGLNMSLADLAALRDLSANSPGSRESLEQYHRKRWPDARLRVTGIDALNRASMVQSQPLRDIRAAGLSALYGARFVRRNMMRLGLGAS